MDESPNSDQRMDVSLTCPKLIIQLRYGYYSNAQDMSLPRALWLMIEQLLYFVYFAISHHNVIIIIYFVFFFPRFPIPDLRPVVERRPWWKQSLRDDSLLLEFFSVKFNTVISTEEPTSSYEIHFQKLDGRSVCMDLSG